MARCETGSAPRAPSSPGIRERFAYLYLFARMPFLPPTLASGGFWALSLAHRSSSSNPERKARFPAAVFSTCPFEKSSAPPGRSSAILPRFLPQKDTQKRRSAQPVETALDHPFLGSFPPKKDNLDFCYIVCVASSFPQPLRCVGQLILAPLRVLGRRV
jgi:hypothetical protein